MTVELKMNWVVLGKAAERAFQKTCLKLGEEMTRKINDPNAFPSHPGQDIVDTTRLRESQQITFPKPGTVIFAYPVDYAVYVHEGYTLRNGTRVQGRPWTKAAQTDFNFLGAFTVAWTQELARGVFRR